MILNEMAIDRGDAVTVCVKLSREFINHFNKAFREGIESPSFSHHCDEMQAWWDKVNGFVLKQNKKKVASSDLVDWFFLGGSDTDKIFKGDEDRIDVYNEFMIKILGDRDNADLESILREILLRYGV